MADDLKLKASFDDKASAGVRKLGKTLADLKPGHGMAAAQKWMGDFRKGADTTVAALRPVSGMMNSVGVGGLAASLSIGEMVKQFRDLADSTLTLKELGRQSRMSATEIARLQYAAGKLHVDPAAMSGAIGSWSSKMVEFRMHTSQFYRDLMRQNADVAAKIESDSPIDGLKRALDFISRIKDPQIQKRWADDAGLGDLAPMLGKGPDGLAAAFSEAGREVKPITQEMQDAADRFNEATNRFNQTWANFKNDLGPSILDPLSHTLDKLDEGMKWAAKYPGDAAAAAATIAGSFAGLYLRMRIMRRSALAGGGGAAAGEMAGAAREQVKAGGSLIEAAVALKEAAAELRGRGAAPGGGAPAEPGKPGGSSPGYASLTFQGVLAAFNLLGAAEGMPEQLKRAETDNAPMDPEVAREAGWGDRLRKFFRGSSAEMHPDDDRLSRARPDDLKRDVQEGSKAGIIAGLRELAQQQELGGSSGVGETTGGAQNLRYGRPSASGGFRTTPGRHSGGSAGGDHGSGGPPGIDYNAKSALEQMGITKGEWDAFREGVTDIEGKRYDRMGGGGGRYAGRYQMGPAEIAATAARLGVPRPSNAQFLADPAMQERFFENYTMDHRRTLMNDPKFAALSPREQLKILGYAHNQGAGGPGNRRHGPNGAWGYLENGQAGHDGFGTSGAAYPQKIQRRLDKLDTGTAADAFKARQKAFNGTPPQAHARGGAIRGPGSGTSDSIPALLSNGEYVVRASAAGRFLPWLHAINEGGLSRFANGGPVGKPLTIRGKPWVPPVGFGVDKRFYPTSSPGISDAEGHDNRRSWRDFFRRPLKDGGMGAPLRTTLGALAMMQGESGRGLNSKLYDWDVNGPSGGVDQLHDVTTGKFAGRLHRLSDAMTDAMLQHVDWQDRTFQQAHFKKEATGSMWWAWRKMLAAKTAAGALRAGVNDFENPADHDGEFRRRLPNIAKLAREDAGGTRAAEIDPVQIDIRHHPHTGRPIVTARAGKGATIKIRTAPTMRPT